MSQRDVHVYMLTYVHIVYAPLSIYMCLFLRACVCTWVCVCLCACVFLYVWA
jgi:hypothetical protein